MDFAILAVRLALAVVLVVAAVAKLPDLQSTRIAAVQLGLPARLGRPVSLLLPVVELAVGVALIPMASARWAAAGAFVLLAVFCLLVGRAMVQGESPDCNCFGVLGSARVGRMTLVRDSALTVLAAFVAFAPQSPGESLGGWVRGLSNADRVALWMGLALAGVVAIAAWFGRELLRQQGRLLLRIEALEAPSRPRLPPGAPAPGFVVDRWRTGQLSLHGLLDSGLPLVLVFSDAQCGPCMEAIPVIAHAQRESAGAATICMLSRGATPESEAAWGEHRVDHVGVVSDFEVAQSYGFSGFPSAVLVSPEGRIASQPAHGLAKVTELLRAQSRHNGFAIHHVDPAARDDKILEREGASRG